jgi:hypothetical protein
MTRLAVRFLLNCEKEEGYSKRKFSRSSHTSHSESPLVSHTRTKKCLLSEKRWSFQKNKTNKSILCSGTGTGHFWSRFKSIQIGAKCGRVQRNKCHQFPFHLQDDEDSFLVGLDHPWCLIIGFRRPSVHRT